MRSARAPLSCGPAPPTARQTFYRPFSAARCRACTACTVHVAHRARARSRLPPARKAPFLVTGSFITPSPPSPGCALRAACRVARTTMDVYVAPRPSDHPTNRTLARVHAWRMGMTRRFYIGLDYCATFGASRLPRKNSSVAAAKGVYSNRITFPPISVTRSRSTP